MRPSLAALSLLVVAACASGPPETTDVEPARSAEAIAERFLEARRRGDAEEMWCCLVGRPDRKRVYRGVQAAGHTLRWDEFVRDVDLGWRNPALAPAETWKKVDGRREDGLTVLVFRQGTEEEPDRGLLEVAARPTGCGWLVAWVDVAR